jgi:hypothetical protein
MVTVHREAGLRIRIFTDDHEPAHVHVLGQGHAKVNLLGPDGLPELVFARGMTIGEVRKMLRIVGEQQDMLVARWRDIHGK